MIYSVKKHHKSNTNMDTPFMKMEKTGTIKELSDMMQKNIKKNNNSIELKKAIKY